MSPEEIHNNIVELTTLVKKTEECLAFYYENNPNKHQQRAELNRLLDKNNMLLIPGLLSTPRVIDKLKRANKEAKALLLINVKLSCPLRI